MKGDVFVVQKDICELQMHACSHRRNGSLQLRFSKARTWLKVVSASDKRSEMWLCLADEAVSTESILTRVN